MDIAYVGILTAWCLATWGLLRLCDRLASHEPDPPTEPKQQVKR